MRDWPERIRGDPTRTSAQQRAEDAYLRRLVAAARSVHDPLSVFLGAKRVMVHVYNDAGQMVRSESPGWSAGDRDVLLALMEYEADLCPGCRQPLVETTNPENEDRYDAGRPLLCHRCVATEQAASKYESHQHSGALLIPVALRDPI